MQVFCPYSSPLRCAEALWADQLRYNKQIVECRQIIAAIDGAKAWRSHPVCLMYKEHKEWLKYYAFYFIAYKEQMNTTSNWQRFRLSDILSRLNRNANKIRPPFLTDEFCDQHKRRLYTKSPDLYPQFAEYGKSDENWYFLNGQIVKYVNGKRVK